MAAAATVPSGHSGEETPEDLQFEILRSEHLRARALMSLLGGLFVMALLLLAWPREQNPLFRLLGDSFPARSIALFYGIGALYELFVSRLIGRAIEKRQYPAEAVRYLNAFVETSFPTILLILVCDATGPAIALNSPSPMLYFLFISLSTLRLGAALPIFTGCVAAAQFLAVALYYLPSDPETATFFTARLPVILKAFVLVRAGLVCGFIGAEIRKRLVASLDMISEKNRVLGMFGQYVSPAVVEKLMTQSVDHEGEVRNVTVMFLDIRDFTSFSERRSPQEVVEYLNVLFGRMITVINANNGVINKFLGDGFMACFGAPLSDGRDTQNAVRAALEIAASVDAMNAAGDIAPTRIGIGLHAGPAVTGSVGSEERREYTIIGDTVNLASRVEQLTKQFGTCVLVTDSVWEVVKGECAGRALEPVLVKGREQPVAIYALA